MAYYDVGFVYSVDGHAIPKIQHERLNANSRSDAVGKFYQRHPGGVHWVNVAETEAPAYQGKECPHCGSDNTRRLTAPFGKHSGEMECWDCRRTW